ncbi:S8 family serine peptidase [Micromonospora sp. ANENR4]|uniref:S8 family serine peptidase n=1 Tax=Micromonospora sp. ANENR4 TaxID=2783662 RepID=UPI00188FABFA|nr:S8 family serine peptidase [Micromonospora sp. ANENR4]MBF5030422.1 S8 family serine peptidase [Micromonospora sp. ANENR4]
MLRNRRKLTAFGLGLTLALGLPVPALAAAPTAPTGPSARTGPSAPAGVQPVTVTLITGDRVTVASGGRAAVRPGAGRAGIQFLVGRERDRLTVMPQDALPLVRAGKLDRRLFDVSGLIEAGYDDARRGSVPLLVTYRPGTARRTAAPLAGARVTRDLPAIAGAAVVADKGDTGALWKEVSADRSGARLDAAGGVDRIWLDGRRRLTLDHSVPQIGAPTAWAAGWTGKGVRVAVLDTGVDLSHPDLAGKVAESRNFTEEADPDDIVGHGTHVASTIAGSGAASGGKYRGVAPDATLLSGKVCEVYGCTESAILAGMQWAAAEQHATVVNMSLSGGDTPDVDPLEEAVGTLTEQHGTLFVISAGNDGVDGSVGSPATADAALAVGAVDRDDALADFSSRGPRVGDGAIKPDITAPGVEIVAARAANGQIGDPVGDRYASLSGTSMAAPHVAGAVALLAQQHPGWTPERYKATLMASAKPHPEQTAFQQGAGRVDVARAMTQQVTSEPASVSFGVAAWPHTDDKPISRTVTYRNGGTAPLTLDLSTRFTGPGGRTAPAGMLTLSTSRLTVPAGGSAQATVVIDTRLGGADGYWTGRLLARAGDTVAVTPLAVDREVESYDLTVTHRNRSGALTDGYYTVLLGLDDGSYRDVYGAGGETRIRVPKGRYGAHSLIFVDGDQGWSEVSFLAQPELVVAGNQRLTLDARRAKPIRTTVPQRGAAPLLIDLTAAWGFGDYYNSFGLWTDRFEGLYSAQIGRTVSDKVFVGALASQWAEPTAPERSPYFYGLNDLFPGRFPTGFVRHYRPADLAAVTNRFAAGYAGMENELVVYAERDYNMGGSAIVLPVQVPGKRIDHLSVTRTRWSAELAFGERSEEGWLEPRAALERVPTRYRAGHTYRDEWNKAPFGPSFPQPQWPEQGITRTGDTLVVSLPVHSDAAGHPGGSLNDTEHTRLYRNGELVDESPYPGYGEFTVPPGTANYRVETTATRGFTDLSTEVSASWTFRSKRVPGDVPARLPATAVRFTPPLAVDSSAPAGRTFTVPVTVQRQPGAPSGRVVALTVDVSYDGGKTWQKAALKKQGGAWTATVRHPAGPGYASLRATARDDAGNTVTQRIIQAYRLR